MKTLKDFEVKVPWDRNRDFVESNDLRKEVRKLVKEKSVFVESERHIGYMIFATDVEKFFNLDDSPETSKSPKTEERDSLRGCGKFIYHHTGKGNVHCQEAKLCKQCKQRSENE